MSRMKRNWDLRLGLLVALVVAAGCEDVLLNDPAPAVAGLAVSYTVAEAATPAEGPLADHAFQGARVAVLGEDGSVLGEETVELGSPGEEIRVQFVVPMEGNFRTVRVAVELLSHGEVARSGSAVVEIENGTTTQVGVEVAATMSFQATISGVVSDSVSGNWVVAECHPSAPVVSLDESVDFEGDDIVLYIENVEGVTETTYTPISNASYYSSSAETRFECISCEGSVTIEEVSATRIRGNFDFIATHTFGAVEGQVHVVGSFSGVNSRNDNCPLSGN